jgi:hypothetical protein
MSFIIIQLIEYFIWKNIKNPYYNSFYTKIAGFIFLLQPVISLMILKDKPLRNILLSFYLIVAIPYCIYKLFTKKIHSTVSPLGHIQFHLFADTISIIFGLWIFVFLFSFLYEGYYEGFLFGAGTLFLMTYTYIKDNSVGSMWCWIVNTAMMYYAFLLLFYLPFFEKGKLCL